MSDANGVPPAEKSGGGTAGGSAETPAPAAERIVIRDKRKVSPMGDAARPDEPASPTNGANMAKPEAPGQPATPADEPEVAASAEAVDDPAETTEELVVVGEVVEAEPIAEAEDAAGPAEESDDEEIQPIRVSEQDGAGPLGAELEMLRKQLDEAQVDIKRVAAEYKNYRDRVKRDQAAAAETATAAVLTALLPVLDDLDRAREHGDLTGPFGSVAEQLLTATGKFGLTAFGSKGDPFDPNRHEAVAHLPSADVTEETCIDVMRRGYMLGDRLLRPAMVAVAAPQE
ncbi:nucleotide exchange factor GrpE [Hamadaea tsunoensis]|uniref:nucleotide exchange factor GrpE n=1 Tax=Hamadaea tsunoensis TaxID=53368 RepID=UPI0003F93F98|nr:nucleotide exchange factor GrpE [Hamadaea tsunoensis]